MGVSAQHLLDGAYKKKILSVPRLVGIVFTGDFPASRGPLLGGLREVKNYMYNLGCVGVGCP